MAPTVSTGKVPNAASEGIPENLNALLVGKKSVNELFLSVKLASTPTLIAAALKKL